MAVQSSVMLDTCKKVGQMLLWIGLSLGIVFGILTLFNACKP